MASKLYRVSGTMISVVPFKKGIIIAADSRLTLDMGSMGRPFTDRMKKIRITSAPQRAFAITGAPTISDPSRAPLSPPFEDYILNGAKIFDAHPIVSDFLNSVDKLLSESDLMRLSDNILRERGQVVGNFAMRDEMEIIIIEHSRRKLLRCSQIARIRYYFNGYNALNPVFSIEKYYFYSKCKLNLYGDEGEYNYFVNELPDQRSIDLRNNRESLSKKNIFGVKESDALSLATEVIQMTVDYIHAQGINPNSSIGGAVTRQSIK